MPIPGADCSRARFSVASRERTNGCSPLRLTLKHIPFAARDDTIRSIVIFRNLEAIPRGGKKIIPRLKVTRMNNSSALWVQSNKKQLATRVHSPITVSIAEKRAGLNSPRSRAPRDARICRIYFSSVYHARNPPASHIFLSRTQMHDRSGDADRPTAPTTPE